ncbi:Hypothetical_protein [Hexamita inflata]|uniref:Hypothetical_protein n=1 Tax=Hexamita inflata TaxID=28002 RepID=A0AA86VRJ3_9EUKA|nr:Hypothetical protein HINF_LOCUS62238 [Hexamita inflata]
MKSTQAKYTQQSLATNAQSTQNPSRKLTNFVVQTNYYAQQLDLLSNHTETEPETTMKLPNSMQKNSCYSSPTQITTISSMKNSRTEMAKTSQSPTTYEDPSHKTKQKMNRKQTDQKDIKNQKLKKIKNQKRK